jgi:putative transposase
LSAALTGRITLRSCLSVLPPDGEEGPAGVAHLLQYPDDPATADIAVTVADDWQGHGPGGPWTVQQIRNLLMDLGDRVAEVRFLVRDRGGQFTASFDAILADAGIEAIKIPPRSPRANAYAERFVLTARTEVTDRMLIFGERHLRTVMAGYARHCNGQRPHRRRELRPPRPARPVADLSRKRIKRGRVLGGLVSGYERVA